MKKKLLLFSALLLLAVSLTVNLSYARYKETVALGTLDVTLKEHKTYTYAVLENDPNTNTKTKLSIRNRKAAIVTDENGNPIQLVDKDGTYNMADVYALPDAFNAKNDLAPVENILNLSSLKTTLTSIEVEGYLQDSLSSMFANFTALQTADFGNADFTAVTSTKNMFDRCSALTSIIFADSIDTSNVTDMYGMFEYCAQLQTVNVSGFDTAKVTDMMNMFRGCDNLTNLDVSNFDTSNVTNMQEIFRDCKSLTTLDLSNFDTSNVTNMRQMFYIYPNSGTSYLEEIIFGEKFDTSKVENMQQMFYGLSHLKTLDLSSFDTSSVTNMIGMFQGCVALTSLDLSHLDTSNVKDMSAMFGDCQFASLDVSVLDTSNVSNMSQMFQGCQANITFGGSFDTSNVINMSNMFAYCTRQTSFDLSSFDTSNVTNMSKMFFRTNNIKSLDLSSFDTSKVTNMSGMFGSDRAHIYPAAWETIIVSNNFVIKSGANTSEMFRDCKKLVGGNGTKYNGNKQDGEYARIDGAGGQPGYFTATPHTDHGIVTYVANDDEATHTAYCEIYGEPVGTPEAHTLVNGVCQKCAYIKKTVYAIYDESDHSLKFYNQAVLPDASELQQQGKTLFTDFINDTGFGYTGLQAPWRQFADEIQSVVVVDAFKAKNLTCWFTRLTEMTSCDVSKLDVSAVTSFQQTFADCVSLTTLDLSTWQTSNAINMTSMFDAWISAQELGRTSSLTTIYVSAEKWSMAKVTHSDLMFDSCTSLVGGANTTYDASHTDATYARIDGGTSAPGYFTAKTVAP